MTDRRFKLVLMLSCLSLVGCPPPRGGNISVDNSQDPASEPAAQLEIREEHFDDTATIARRTEGRVDADGTFIAHGLTTDYWRNGQKKGETTFVDGVRHGPRRAWYASGQAWSEGDYVDGKEDGAWTSWFPDGRKAGQITFKLGAFDGVWLDWHPNGQKKREVVYVKGRRQGLETVWDEDGNVVKQVEYVDNVAQP